MKPNNSPLVSYFGIGSGANAFKNVQFVTQATGWKGFTKTYLDPQIAAGLSRFLLWMPFGTESVNRVQNVAGRMIESRVRFDQYLLATMWQNSGFVDAIAPYTEKGIQIIAYTGTLHGAPEYEALKYDAADQWINDCLKPFKDAKCDLAFDTSIASPEGHYVFELVRKLRNQNVKVYCESMPRNWEAKWSKGDVIADEADYQSSTKLGNRPPYEDPKNITGDLIRGIWGGMATADWVPTYQKVIPAAVHEGHSVCFQARYYLNNGGKIADLLV